MYVFKYVGIYVFMYQVLLLYTYIFFSLSPHTVSNRQQETVSIIVPYQNT